MRSAVRIMPHHASASSRLRPAFTLIELLVVIAFLALLTALLLPATRRAGPAARRSHCQSNLKQILIALHNYHERCGAFPPAYTVDSQGQPLHSWRTLILPELEQEVLYRTIDLSKPWDDPANAHARTTSVPVYECAETPAKGSTQYLALVAQGSCLRPAEPRKLSDISDNHARTAMVVEVDAGHAVPWMAPNDADELLFLELGTKPGLSHPGVVLTAFVDGHVEGLAAGTLATLRRAMISIAGND